MHMKLRDIYVTCKHGFDNILCGTKDDFINVDIVNDGVKLLSNIECLKGSVNKVLEATKPLSGNCSIIDKQHANSTIQKLLFELGAIIKLCESVGWDNEEIIGLDVKLPANNSLTDLKECISDLEFVFTRCPYFKDEKETIEFRNIDVGSIWLTFAVVGGSLVTGSIILNNIAAFVDKCFIIKSHHLTTLQQKSELEKAEMENDEKKVIFESIDKIYKIAVDNAIRELEEVSGYEIKDGEEKGITEQCFDKTIKLMDKGLQIYSSIDSPKEVKALFEPLEMKYLNLNNELKLLEKDNNQEEDKKD